MTVRSRGIHHRVAYPMGLLVFFQTNLHTPSQHNSLAGASNETRIGLYKKGENRRLPRPTCFLHVKNYPLVKFMLAAAAATSGVLNVSCREEFPPPMKFRLCLR